MIAFSRGQKPASGHPNLEVDVKSRPSKKDLLLAAEVVSRPFVAFFLRELRRRIQPDLQGPGDISLNHFLVVGEESTHHTLELLLNYEVAALINLLDPEIIWCRDFEGNLIYVNEVRDPDAFRNHLETAVFDMLGWKRREDSGLDDLVLAEEK